LVTDEGQDAFNSDEDILIQNQLPESIIEPFIISDPLCCRLIMYYILEMLKRRYLEVILSKAWFYLSRSHCGTVPCVKYQTAKLAFFCASKFPKIKRDYLLECFKTAKENVGDAEIVDQNSLEDTHTFERIFEAVENKFDDIDVHENEILAHGTPGTATTETLAPAHILNARSLSDDFPEVPTPMTPHF
uniref:Uncharacterized protein n=1 Tax=Romanomermis culicivorax TaxID=13658 RepID=A0A915KJ70_ROMCU